MNGLRLLRHGGIYRSDEFRSTQPGAGWPPPVGRLPGPVRGATEGTRPGSSSAMSSGRLFLDRVARQQSPSPLHRQFEHVTERLVGARIKHRTADSPEFPCLTRGVHFKGVTPQKRLRRDGFDGDPR
jgi:hypothetical protein